MPEQPTIAHAVTFTGDCLAQAFDKASVWLRERGYTEDDGTTVCIGTSISYDEEHGEVLFTLTLQGCMKPGCCTDDGVPGCAGNASAVCCKP